MLVLSVSVVQAQVVGQDSLALVVLYNATDGPTWDNNTNWLTGPVSTWHGVTVVGGRVTMVVLGGNNLTGVLPSDLDDLTALEFLALGDNALSGSLPAALGSLSVLRNLILSDNALSGPLPAALGSLTALEQLWLNNNQFSGALPLNLTNLTALNTFWFNDTSLCEPADAVFQAWIQGLPNVQSTGVTCPLTAM